MPAIVARPVIASAAMLLGNSTGARRRTSLRARLTLLLILSFSLAACNTGGPPPSPTPADFGGIATDLTVRGIAVSHITSGDAGCPDQKLARTAIGFTASGLDQTAPVRLHAYLFANRAKFEELRGTVDVCARSYLTDPAAYESVDVAPFVIAGQGPWGGSFRSTIRNALEQAAGGGG